MWNFIFGFVFFFEKIKLEFEIYDLGEPELSNSQTATVNVNVVRNNAPRFTDPQKSVIVDEDEPAPYNLGSFTYFDPDTVQAFKHFISHVDSD